MPCIGFLGLYSIYRLAINQISGNPVCMSWPFNKDSDNFSWPQLIHSVYFISIACDIKINNPFRTLISLEYHSILDNHEPIRPQHSIRTHDSIQGVPEKAPHF